MAASSESGHSRKRIATYGKSVRKWPSDQIAFKTFQELDRIPVAPNQSPEPASYAGIIRDNDSFSTSPISSTKAFDVPLRDYELNGTPKKKRKIAHPDGDGNEQSTDSLEQHGRLMHHLTSEDAGGGIIAHKVSRHIPRVDQGFRQRPVEKWEEIHMSSTKISPASQKAPLQPPLRPFYESPPRISAVQSSLSGREAAKPKLPPKIQQGTDHPPTTPSKTQLAAAGYRPSNPGSSSTLDDTEVGTDSGRNSSAVLTPRGTKMWNNLLGGNSNDAVQGQESDTPASEMDIKIRDRESRKSTQNGPHRRLIDSLAGESKNSRSLLDLYSDLEEQESTVSIPKMFLHTFKNQGAHPNDSTTMQAAPETVTTLTKATGGRLSSQAPGSKITYSHQRSMLAEQDPIDIMTFQAPLEEAVIGKKLQSRRKSVSSLPTLNGFLESPEAEGDKAGVAIRTIHELRQAGAESRFKDEVEDLLDRIGNPAQRKIGRRSGLMELAEKMRDRQFLTKFLTNGIDQQLFLDLGQEQDVISGFIMVVLLILVLDGGIAAATISQLRRQGVTRLFARLLDSHESILIIASRRKSNMSKSAQEMLSDQHAYLLGLRAWDEIRPSSVSPRTACLRCLELIIRRSREAGETGDVMSKELISKVFGILKPFTNNIPAGADAIDFQLAISTLESHSVKPTTDLDEHVPILKDILEWKLKANSGDPVIPLLLRLVLNATNKSSTVSDALASPNLLRLLCHAVIERFGLLSGFVAEEERLSLINQLVLLLIVMINVVELSIRARQCFLMIQDSSLNDLVRIFEGNITKAFEADSVEDSHLNVAGGYLAVLLGYLALSSDVWERIAQVQQTPTLQPLIACIDEFISHHKKVDDLLKEEGESTPKAGLTDRLQSLVDMLKARQKLH